MTPLSLMKFNPELTPKEIIQLGSFGGIYFSTPLCIASSYPQDWFEGLSESQYCSQKYNKAVNYFKVKSGLDQEQWDKRGWMHSDAPRGWFQWYCDLYIGKNSVDSERQIDRWVKFQRWLTHKESPVINQSLLHWAYNRSGKIKL